ncbi:MAG: TerB N-terminal domain-containing protein [Candidatus Limnocylindrales bacterium]
MEIIAVIVVVIIIIGWRNRRASQPSPRAVVATIPRRPRGAASTGARQSGAAIRFDVSYGALDIGPDAAARGATLWKPAGISVAVQGGRIDAGLVYVGRGLAALDGGQPEPALIDPTLPIDGRRIDWAGQGLDYWPSYSAIPPGSRAAYLGWLIAGRPVSDISVGYVFLFLYGLERRMLVDARHLPAAAAEVPTIRAEVERLLAAYGANNSFRSYASNFLSAIDALWPSSATASRHAPQRNWELPLDLRVRLGRHVAATQPIPSALALEWVLAAPEIDLRTPATRCATEFRRLFEMRYDAVHVTGLKIREPRRRLVAHYRPASASFGGPVELQIGDLPDVTGLSAPMNLLRQLADACTTDLDAYSRWIGRNPDGAQSLGATALLPVELVGDQQGAALADLRSWLEGHLDGHATIGVPAADLLRHWPTASGWQPTRAESVSLAQLLGKLGFAIEPDVRFEGPVISPSSAVVLYRLAAGETAAVATPEYALATLVAHLGMAVAAADGTVSQDELARLDEHMSVALTLAPHERTRLVAHTRWLQAAAPPLSGMRKRIASLTSGQRDDLGEFLVAVAAADGRIGPTEVASLEKMFALLGFDANLVFARVHAFSTGAGGEPRSEATLRSGAGGPIVLDMERVEAKLRETQAVSLLLGGVFVDEAEPQPANQELPPEATVAGLDSQHSGLLRALRGRDHLARAELEALVRLYRLLPDGAIDTINDAAFDSVGHPIVEADDPILIDTEALEEMLA